MMKGVLTETHINSGSDAFHAVQLRVAGAFDRLLLNIEDIAKVTSKQSTIAVLVLTCNRPENLNRTIQQVFRYSTEEAQSAHVDLPIIVSQDCTDEKTSSFIESLAKEHNFTHILQPDQSDIGNNLNLSKNDRRFLGYYNIARHYRWALNQVFHVFNHSAVIVVEDDLDLSPDFFEYFVALVPVLNADPTLWCISAWNDNGKFDYISNEPELLYRSDFFPGLGWLIQKSTWTELEPRWPYTFWDDWMRNTTQRRSRACIRPEIPRSSTFGRLGTSNGQYFDSHLRYVQHYNGFVNFTKLDLTYLEKRKYDLRFTATVRSKQLVQLNDILLTVPYPKDAVRLEYSDWDSFNRISTALGIMPDCKSGVPRMAYRGVVSFIYKGTRIYLAPSGNWTGYDETWKC